MRIYYVGAHRTGKTRLVRKTHKKYPNLRKLSEVARAVLGREESDFADMRLDVDEVSAYQRDVFEEQVRIDQEAGDDFVSDRAFDNLAYAAEHAECLSDMVKLPIFRPYIERVSKGLVFFTRPLPAVKADGVVPAADLDRESVVRIDGMVKFMLEEWGVPYINLSSPSPKDRWNDVKRIIDLAVRAESPRP